MRKTYMSEFLGRLQDHDFKALLFTFNGRRETANPATNNHNFERDGRAFLWGLWYCHFESWFGDEVGVLRR